MGTALTTRPPDGATKRRCLHEGLAAGQPPLACSAAPRCATGRGGARSGASRRSPASRRPYKLRTSLALGSLLVAALIALVPPLLARAAINDGIVGGDLELLTWLVAAFILVGALGLLASSAQTYFTGWTGERILADLRNTLFRHLQRLSLGYYERNRAGVIISRITNDVEALDQLVTDGVTTLVQNTLILVGSAVILFFLDWRLALAVMSVIPFMIVATAFFRSRSSRAYNQVRERLGLVTATLAEDIGGMRVVQAFTREDANRRRFEEVNAHYRAANHQTVVLSGWYFPTVDFLSAIATAIVLGYGGYLVFDDAITIGTLFAFILYLSNFFDPVQQLSQLYNTFLAATAALDKIMDVIDEEPEVLDRPGALDLAQIHGDVRFDDGALRATAAATRCCTGSTWTSRPVRRSRSSATPAPASRRSPSCSRASTTRIDGRITIDGIDLRDVTQASLRRQLGDRAPGGLPVRRHGARQHRVRPARRDPRGRRRGRDQRSARTSSSSGSRTATTRSCRSAARASRSASASSSRSPARCSPTRGS